MMRFRKASTIPLTASLFRIDQPNAIPFTINRACALTVTTNIRCLTPSPRSLDPMSQVESRRKLL